MRILIVAAAVTTFALLAAGMLGVASAEAPTTTAAPPTTTTTAAAPTVNVEGVAIEAIEQTASATAATAVYRQGMADAIVDGQAKAQFLASKAGVTLGAVQSIAEGGGYIGCTGNETEYLGEQPDFGSSGVEYSAAGTSAPRALAKTNRSTSSKPTVKRVKKRKPVAKRASAPGCTLSAQVSLTYAIS